jgi:hypothetical protein
MRARERYRDRLPSPARLDQIAAERQRLFRMVLLAILACVVLAQ